MVLNVGLSGVINGVRLTQVRRLISGALLMGTFKVSQVCPSWFVLGRTTWSVDIPLDFVYWVHASSVISRRHSTHSTCHTSILNWPSSSSQSQLGTNSCLPLPRKSWNASCQYAETQESIQKDVEHSFGVLQQRFRILALPYKLWHPEGMHNIMLVCIMLHNMIVEDELHPYDYVNDYRFEDGWVNPAPPAPVKHDSFAHIECYAN
ncbi:unnamed protein product [Phytophthora fragariaefolia]|uniref:Unnamed protein product n=1 Tax=Phytophthora fragariaefolia TaxID=1490495 RepID=A0A9W6XMN9_9STRA|nr:unnamed protein product [Phytophthora fragariaefolia]